MLVYFAISLVALLGFCGLALDVGRMELRQVQLQAAADASALSAAAELQHANASWQSAATAEATSMAAANGYPTPTVTVQRGATFGAYANDNSAVQVTLTQPFSTTFLKLIGMPSASLSAKAAAMIPPCVFLMGNPGIPSRGGVDLSLASTGLNNLPCPTYAKDGYSVDGFSHICCTTPKTSGPASGSNVTGWTSPAIQYNSPRIADPLAYIAAPVFTGCTYTAKIYTGNIGPGTYCGGIKVSNSTLNMAPGLYIVTGGVSFSASTINGTGVTIYLTQGGGSGFGWFGADHSTLNLSAPTDASAGGIAGILLFGDRNWTPSSPGQTEDFSFVFSSLYGDGIIYTTGTGIYDWTSPMSAPHYFTMVTANLSPQAAAIVPSANYSLLPGGDPLHLPIALIQ